MPRDPALEYLSKRSRQYERRARLRPKSSSEIMDSAASIYRIQGLTILRHIVGPMLGSFAILVMFLAVVAPGLFVTQDADNLSRQVSEVLQVIAIGVLAALPAFLIGIGYASAATALITANAILDQNQSDSQIRMAAARSLTTIFWVMVRSAAWFAGIAAISTLLLLVGAALQALGVDNPILGGVCALLGVLGIVTALLVSPIVLTRYSLAPAIVVVENVSPRRATKRSAELMSSVPGNSGGDGMLQVWGLMFLIGVAVFAGVETPIELFDLQQHIPNWVGGGTIGEWCLLALRLLPWFLTLWLVVPIWCVTTTLIYFDRRIRWEAYDIELLSEDVLQTKRGTRIMG